MRQEITKQLIEILATIVILVILLTIIYGACVAVRNASINSTKETKSQSQSPIKAFELYTGQHDGHLWILNRTSSYFLHHPDCPCSGKSEKDGNLYE